MRQLLFILLFCAISSFSVQAETLVKNDSIKEVTYDKRENVTPVNFQKESLEKYKEQDAFNYLEEEQVESWWSNFKRWLFNIFDTIWNYLFGDLEAKGFVGFLLKSIPYLVIGGIIALIVWLFIKLNPGKGLGTKNKEQEVFLSEEQEIIENKNIEALIEEAIANGDLRLAVRFYYLLILRELKDNQLIAYEQEKTNEDYLKEIKSDQLSNPFEKLTHLYDFVWYGNFSINSQQYKTAEEDFLTLKQQINSPSHD
ncbi:DUF4129 domain-containing protein [Mesonia ostreae]|uniref:DUF4129 domain-containing protein n=1 Tax=Mesonia ostreae TaxID=861110 RepID=A0ABU2KLV5_9FLAO|nr:DUF4129 domain-containing protein [Mesonia ostreae]MDT0295684.1 DUF4129 domain-containing protein [Mesonia ostreae]